MSLEARRRVAEGLSSRALCAGGACGAGVGLGLYPAAVGIVGRRRDPPCSSAWPYTASAAPRPTSLTSPYSGPRPRASLSPSSLLAGPWPGPLSFCLLGVGGRQAHGRRVRAAWKNPSDQAGRARSREAEADETAPALVRGSPCHLRALTAVLRVGEVQRVEIPYNGGFEGPQRFKITKALYFSWYAAHELTRWTEVGEWRNGPARRVLHSRGRRRAAPNLAACSGPRTCRKALLCYHARLGGAGPVELCRL